MKPLQQIIKDCENILENLEYATRRALQSSTGGDAGSNVTTALHEIEQQITLAYKAGQESRDKEFKDSDFCLNCYLEGEKCVDCSDKDINHD